MWNNKPQPKCGDNIGNHEKWDLPVPIDKYEKPISNETASKKLITEHRDGTQYTRRALKSHRATERRQHVDGRIRKLNETCQLKFDVYSAVYMSFSD